MLNSYEKLRYKMVKEQIEGPGRNIKDPLVIKAMLNVPRHLFVPEEMVNYAYEDYPLTIGEGQTISQPYIVAFMTEKLHLTKTDIVLEVGTGSGYQTAILAEIVQQVYSLEIIPSLAQASRKKLEELGYTNIQIKNQSGYLGWKDFSPFDSIVVTCAPCQIPYELIKQLKINGRMIIPVGSNLFGQKLMYLEKDDENKIQEKKVLDVRFVPMVKK